MNQNLITWLPFISFGLFLLFYVIFLISKNKLVKIITSFLGLLADLGFLYIFIIFITCFFFRGTNYLCGLNDSPISQFFGIVLSLFFLVISLIVTMVVITSKQKKEQVDNNENNPTNTN